MTVSSTSIPEFFSGGSCHLGRSLGHSEKAECAFSQAAHDFGVVVNARLRQHPFHEREERLGLATNIRDWEVAAPLGGIERACVIALIVRQDHLDLLLD